MSFHTLTTQVLRQTKHKFVKSGPKNVPGNVAQVFCRELPTAIACIPNIARL